MTAKVIDGKALAHDLLEQIKTEVSRLSTKHNLQPGLAVVIVGDDPASHVYVRNKNRKAVEAGMLSFEHKMSETTTEDELLELVRTLNCDETVHGILVQLPLPGHIEEQCILQAIEPTKDVDGFHPVNVGRLSSGDPAALAPCTPVGSLIMLRNQFEGSLSGLNALVIGRSNIVGKPMAQLLLRENCTVTVAHSRTRNLQALCRQADIVVAAVGRPETVRADWIKPGAVVIDVGINRVADEGCEKSRLVGDVSFAEVSEVASAVTPVPGGVGPMTIACLLRNTVIAACRQADLVCELN